MGVEALVQHGARNANHQEAVRELDFSRNIFFNSLVYKKLMINKSHICLFSDGLQVIFATSNAAG